MTRAEEVNAEAKVHERERDRLRRRAQRLADKGCVFMAADLSELAVKEDRFAALCRLTAINMEAE